MKRISENLSAKKILDEINILDGFINLLRAIPFTRGILTENIVSQFQEAKKQAEVLHIPDQFNDAFSEAGWIAYESMSAETANLALREKKEKGMAGAEKYLAEYYDEETLNYGILRLRGHSEFRKRLRLIELAKTDYLAGRYHACIPLLLSLLDGLVGDVSGHVGFFAKNAEMTAWDSIAWHERGLQSLAKIMRLGRNKTNEGSINIPYRNGILHGRELAFDNRIVAAKCWSAIFAVRDWVSAIEKNLTVRPKNKTSLWQTIKDMVRLENYKRALKAWRPREPDGLKHLPYSSGSAMGLPKNSPEHTVAEFLDYWHNERFGPMAKLLVDFTNTSIGKKAGEVRKDFGKCTPISYSIISVVDVAPAVSQITAEIRTQNTDVTREILIRAIYLSDDDRQSAIIRGNDNWCWKLYQNSFSPLIYG